jgi:polysaccharide deacetylase 2 family uncharacterized protein YibQ
VRPLLLALWLWSAAALADPAPAIALIIDDMGYDLAAGRQALALPGAVTYAFLPRTPHTPALAREAYARGKEIMLHLPMQAADERALGPNGLTLHLTEDEFRRTVHDSLTSVPHALGVNNHMGSLLTRHPGAMAWLMAALDERGGLYFVDSRTSEHTVAERAALQYGLPATRRDVFLDNQQDEAAIQAQLQLLVETALRTGAAVGIAHPYPQTLAVLRRELPRLARQGVGLLPVSRIIEQQQRSPLWHASSSPSPTVAKNSKP